MLKTIRKSYGKTEVLKDISFSLKKGEVLAIIGSSGSGKTTLLRCLNFLETPSNGKISVNDKVLFDSNDSSAKSDSEIRKRRLHFGLVFQSFNLFPQYTVIENIMLAPKLAAKEQIKQTGEYMGAKSYKEAHEIIKSNAKSLLERVGLSEKSESYPCNLSNSVLQLQERLHSIPMCSASTSLPPHLIPNSRVKCLMLSAVLKPPTAQ